MSLFVYSFLKNIILPTEEHNLFQRDVMARVFITEIIFKLRHYRTIVIIHDTNDGLHIKVRLMDAHHLFENDSIEFVGLKGYKNLNNLKPGVIAFLQELSNAIVKHLSNN